MGSVLSARVAKPVFLFPNYLQMKDLFEEEVFFIFTNSSVGFISVRRCMFAYLAEVVGKR